MSQPPPVPPTQSTANRGAAYVAPPAGSPPPRNGAWPACLVGCLVLSGVAVVLCSGLGYLGYAHGKAWATQMARKVIQSTIEESNLPREEKDAIGVEVDRVATAYEQGDISLQELGQIMQKLADSKLWGVAVVQGLDAKYIEPSGLTEEEKRQGRKTLSRVLRGAIEGVIEDSELETLSEHFMEEVGTDSKRLRDTISDEELRALLADAEELANRKEIPMEDYEFRFSEKIREIVDAALP